MAAEPKYGELSISFEAHPSMRRGEDGNFHQVDPNAVVESMDVDGVVDRMIEQSRLAGAFDGDGEDEIDEDDGLLVPSPVFIFHDQITFESPDDVQSFPLLSLVQVPAMDNAYVATVWPVFTVAQKLVCSSGLTLLQFDILRVSEGGAWWRVIRLLKDGPVVLLDWSCNSLRWSADVQTAVMFQPAE